MRALLIGPEEKAKIAAAVTRARARPIPWEKLKPAAPKDQHSHVITLADRAPDHVRPKSEIVNIPDGFRLNVSFEQQPAGICLHLSISVNARNRGPHPAAIEMIVQECLAATPHVPDPSSRAWVEEFLINDKPGGLAYNVIFLVAPAQEGHA